MDLIENKIFNLLKLTNKELQTARKKIAVCNFIFIENDYRTLPNKIVTTKGVFDIVGDLDTEILKKSKLTEKYAFSKPDIYKASLYLNKNSWNIYRNALLFFLIDNKYLMLKYLNEKYSLNLTLDDIDKKNILKNAKEFKVKDIKLKNKKNNFKYKNNTIIKLKEGLLMLSKDNDIFKIKKEIKHVANRNVIRRKFRRNSLFYKDEQNNGIAIYS